MLDLHWRKQWRSPWQSLPSPWCCSRQGDSDLGFIVHVTHIPVQDSQNEALHIQGGQESLDRVEGSD
jgi:hypothetical protein